MDRGRAIDDAQTSAAKHAIAGQAQPANLVGSLWYTYEWPLSGHYMSPDYAIGEPSGMYTRTKKLHCAVGSYRALPVLLVGSHRSDPSRVYIYVLVHLLPLGAYSPHAQK